MKALKLWIVFLILLSNCTILFAQDQKKANVRDTLEGILQNVGIKKGAFEFQGQYLNLPKAIVNRLDGKKVRIIGYKVDNTYEATGENGKGGTAENRYSFKITVVFYWDNKEKDWYIANIMNQ